MEYHDPSGLFSLISRDINSRLPLRNLNWQSSTRPLRQIKSLHLEFVPDNFTKNILQPPALRNESDGTTSLDIVRSGVDPRKNAVKERRHQIPGLQTSPYLKIYILRSDDKDTYKATERKKIRDWIRDNAASNAKGKGENHDAFEWLIVHVVVPDTTAASEPRWRESSNKDSDDLKERKQGMKLPGKSTRTVFDKLRADFNESGKTGQDRVAQIRLTRGQMSPDLLPTPAMVTTIEETDEERAKAWNDLMTKFKTLILGPFDLRVRQYEADVTEQESRRSMPGFNFCTFFIHKEGLAKALESIGLVEDALVIYDELSLGLETVLRDIARGQAEGTATSFAPYTDDIKDRIVGAQRSKANGVAEGHAETHHRTETTELDYRERIVRSDISVFDFFSYLFSRQKALILRLANARSASSFTKDGGEDLVLISEVCWRTASFIHNNARTLRRDLVAYNLAQWEKKTTSTLSNNDIDSIVYSWTYTVAGQILEDTASTSVEQFSDLGRRQSLSNGALANHKLPYSYGGASAHPQRTTSLPPRKSRVSELQVDRTSLQSASESDLMMSPPLRPSIDNTKSGSVAPGLLELVTYRAELLMMQRKMMELLAKQRNWLAGWASIREHATSKLEDVDLNGPEERSGDNVKDLTQEASRLLTPGLASTLDSKETFHDAYERLSDRAMRLHVAATQTKSAESIMGDLAILKSQQGDYGYAVSYFQHVLPLYAADGWSLMEDDALRMHAKCLKALNRREEYVTTLLALVVKACGRAKAPKLWTRESKSIDEVVNVAGVLPELVAFSETLDADITNPAKQFFSDIRLDREVMHHEDKDGFALRLRLRHLLDDEIELDQVSARLVHFEDQNQEIWLADSRPSRLKRGLNDFELETSTIAFGPYLIDKIVVRSKKLLFVEEMLPKNETEQTAPDITDSEKAGASFKAHNPSWIFLYPGHHALSADISLARDIIVDKPRHLEIRLNSGWNEVDNVEIRLKPASAGLRLHLADALFEGVELSSDAPAKSGQISLAGLKPDSAALVKVPYSLEQAAKEIFVRLDLRYYTSKGCFSLPTSVRLPTELPLDVDVNDIFQLEALFSNFTVRTTRGTPLSITQATLEPSAVYHVEAPPVLPMPMTVFDKQPTRMVYKITRKEAERGPVDKRAAALALRVQYHSIDDLIANTLRETLSKTLEQSPFDSLSRLILPLLCDRTKQLTLRGDLEMAVLLHEAKVPSFEEIGWSEVIAALPTSVQQPLANWLKSWHSDNAHISLEQEAVALELQHSITMAVDVPRVDSVHQVSLSLMGQQEQHQNDLPITVLGEPVKAKLTVKYSRNWSNRTIFEGVGNDGEHHDQQAKRFVLDIQADPDSWLVGGQRRGHFEANDGDTLSFDIILVPLKLGLQPLPNVDIQVEQANGEAESSNNPHEPSVLSNETHYTSAGQFVQVIRGLRTSRVHVQESPSSALLPSRPGTAIEKEAG